MWFVKIANSKKRYTGTTTLDIYQGFALRSEDADIETYNLNS